MGAFGTSEPPTGLSEVGLPERLNHKYYEEIIWREKANIDELSWWMEENTSNDQSHFIICRSPHTEMQRHQ